MSNDIPSHLRYTDDHEWVSDEGEVVRVGITHFAQDQLGDVVYVDLPAVGAVVAKGQAFGEIDSSKATSDLFAPVSGTVVERNEALEDRPELVNEDVYGDGWLITLAPSDPDELGTLLDADSYGAAIDG